MFLYLIQDVNNVLSSLGFLSEVLDGEGGAAIEKKYRDEVESMIVNGYEMCFSTRLLPILSQCSNDVVNSGPRMSSLLMNGEPVNVGCRHISAYLYLCLYLCRYADGIVLLCLTFDIFEPESDRTIAVSSCMAVRCTVLVRHHLHYPHLL